MLRPHLPSLHLIVGFEAAARLKSFKDAARELSVTPSAVSQRVRKLEDHLGVKLFERVVRGVELTPAGRLYEDEMRKILAELSEVTQRLARAPETRFTLAMNALVAHEMVIPNLASFGGGQGAGGTIEIVTRSSMKTFKPDEADAGIRIGAGAWAGFEHLPVGPLSTVPMCAPALAPRVRDWDDFFDHTLYCAKSRRVETLESLRHPVTGRSHPKVVEFQTLPEAVRAAESGFGVIGGLLPLMNNFVLQDRLRPAFDAERPLSDRIMFIFRSGDSRGGRLDGVFEWLAGCYRGLPRLAVGRSRSPGRGLATTGRAAT